MGSNNFGYGHKIDIKADFRMWRGEKILTQRQQSEELTGYRQTPDGNMAAEWQTHDGQPASAY